MGLTAVSGLGALLSYFIPSYSAEGRTYDDVSALMTCTYINPTETCYFSNYTDPSLFMGLGNFISMPIALAIGRRPVFLASAVLQVVSLILCATNTGYDWHFAARCVLGLAAGQSEALCPLIISVRSDN